MDDSTSAVPIDGAPDPHAQAAEAVQELEIDIRNHPSSAPDTQRLALDLLRLVRENAARLSAEAATRARELLQSTGAGDYLDPDFWRGLGMVLEYQATEIRGLIQRRLRGEYQTDAYGRDDEIIELLRPVAAFLYRSWWRVSVSGLEHVPAEGGALLVANHAGLIPWDSAMLATALLEDHSSPRLARTLHDRWAALAPGLAPALAALGQVPALPENADRLLADGELVSVFPEGLRGAAKLFRERYTLVGFEAGEYIQAALRNGAPIVPTAIIGAEEIYPVLLNLGRLARLLGLPFLPITPFFPWAGLLGLVPLPSRWSILFDAPLDTAGLTAASADDPEVVLRLAGELRARIEALLKRGLAERQSVF